MLGIRPMVTKVIIPNPMDIWEIKAFYL
jgi:hypothetical protein